MTIDVKAILADCDSDELQAELIRDLRDTGNVQGNGVAFILRRASSQRRALALRVQELEAACDNLHRMLRDAENAQ